MKYRDLNAEDACRPYRSDLFILYVKNLCTFVIRSTIKKRHKVSGDFINCRKLLSVLKIMKVVLCVDR